jgi:hypothetical protein
MRAWQGVTAEPIGGANELCSTEILGSWSEEHYIYRLVVAQAAGTDQQMSILCCQADVGLYRIQIDVVCRSKPNDFLCA